jgi:hypothetical protein
LYEAGPTGYGLARACVGAGISCVVAAPSRIRPAADRVKTDRRDAERLARLLRLGEITPVRVSGPEEEAARDLVRAREDARGDVMRARYRLSKLLLRHGAVYDATAWTRAHDVWLRKLNLNRPEWFQPVPAGANHYVAALQSLPGERDALVHASDETWEHVTPLMAIVGPKTPETEPFTRPRVAAWVKKVSGAVGGRGCFLDVLRLSPNHLAATKTDKQPVLAVIHAEARARGVSFVPVVRLSDAPATVRQIAETVACDARGVALRYPMLGTVSADGRSPQELINEMLDAVAVDVVGADLIMDLGFLSEDVEVDAVDLARAIEELVSIGNWRSVVLLGGSMPSTLGGGIVAEGTIGRLPRREWKLWSALVALELSRLPTFGDYAVQNPDPPLEDQPSGPGQRANIRYTTDDATLVPRAVGAVIQEGAEQYRELCRLLVEQEEFAGRDFTWGDKQIAECADGIGEPGWQNQWRGAGTSHHLRHVVDQLAQVR